MKKVPFFLELYLVMFFILVVPIICVTHYNTNKMLQYSEDEIITTALENLSSIKKLNENMMEKVKTETITLAKNKAVEEIAGMKNLSSITGSVESFMKLKDVEKILNQIVYGDDNIYSIYLYIDGADYVITTKNSILQLTNLRDIQWVDECGKGVRRQIGNWITRTVPYTISLQLENKGHSNVITYIYPLTPLTTSTRGVIVVNIYENKFASLINESAYDQNGHTFIIDRNGNVVSHADDSYFMRNLKDADFIRSILDATAESGSIIDREESNKNLYVYVKDTERKWTYVSYHSMNIMMEKVNRIKKTSTLWLVLISGFGLLLTFLIALWISKPLKNLVNTLKTMEDLYFGDEKNEITLLTKAFQQMDTQRQKLYKILKKNEGNVKELFLNDLMKGNLSKYQGSDIGKSIFPYANFVVAILDVDHRERFIRQYTPEQRYYYRTWILNQSRNKLEEFFRVKGLIYMENSITLIMNFNAYDSTKIPRTIQAALKEIQRETRESLKLSFSAGIGGCHGEYAGVRLSAAEAMEAFRYKLLAGNESIIFWDQKMAADNRYFYPYNREKRILNWLYTKKADSIENEIRELIQDIRGADNISYDNIMHIFNQLIAVTIRYLVKNSVNISEIFDNIYVASHKMSELDTLEDIESYLIFFYQQIVGYMVRCESENSTSYIDRIFTYIDKNYTKEIDFHRMSQEIGISYSYIRKIIKEVTGKSLLDLINSKRIDKAKILLLKPKMSVREVALQVGYNNDQSLTRFFKKYEGITPGEFRVIKK